MRLKRLTPQAFDRAAADTRMGDQAREMARAVLVDGRAQVDVATEYGMSKQRVSGAVATIERAYKKTTTPGVSSIRVELDLPETLALELAALAEAMKGCDDAARCAEALDKASRWTFSPEEKLALEVFLQRSREQAQEMFRQIARHCSHLESRC